MDAMRFSRADNLDETEWDAASKIEPLIIRICNCMGIKPDESTAQLLSCKMI